MPRKAISPVTQADVVIKSKRRCALCFGVDNDLTEKTGQIAHINGDNSDARFENLAWLCLSHHDKFDSKTSQTKNYTQLEVKTYRDNLYKHYSSSDYDKDEIDFVKNYLREYSGMFQYIFREYSELAYKIDDDMHDVLTNIRDFWHTSNMRSFNISVRDIQDRIANNIVGICAIYEVNMYDWVGNYIKFDKNRFDHSILVEKKEIAKEYVDAIAICYKQLEDIATIKI